MVCLNCLFLRVQTGFRQLFFYFKDYNNFAEHEYIRSLHDMYSQALVHEMRLNKRTQSYFDKLSKVINSNVQLGSKSNP